MRCVHVFVLEAGQGEVYMYIVDYSDVLTVVVADGGAIFLVLRPMLSSGFAFVIYLCRQSHWVCKLYYVSNIIYNYMLQHVLLDPFQTYLYLEIQKLSCSDGKKHAEILTYSQKHVRDEEIT